MIRHQTKTELALHVLREKVRTGDLPPGERLRVRPLSEELGMSPTPIREALRLLQADGLVNYQPHLGIVVASFSAEEAAEITQLRILLEPFATKLAITSLEPRDLRELERLHQKLVTVAGSEHGRTITSINAAWHWKIYEASKSSYLTDFIRRLWAKYPWRTMWALPMRVEKSVEEHAMIMTAITNRDGELAAERMRAHIASAAQSLLGQLDSE